MTFYNELTTELIRGVSKESSQIFGPGELLQIRLDNKEFTLVPVYIKLFEHIPVPSQDTRISLGSVTERS